MVCTSQFYAIFTNTNVFQIPCDNPKNTKHCAPLFFYTFSIVDIRTLHNEIDLKQPKKKKWNNED